MDIHIKFLELQHGSLSYQNDATGTNDPKKLSR